MYFYKKEIAVAFLAVGLTACGHQLRELENVGKEPAMDKVSIPMEKDEYRPLEWDLNDRPRVSKQYANSLWQQGSREFFQDTNTRRIGDIIKIMVEIQDKAELDNETTRDRTGSEAANAPKLFGLEEKILGMVPGVADPSSLISTSGTSTSTGTGTIAREEKITTQIAAMVTQILPNGNLVVHGNQEVRVNFEVRRVTVDGIVRPQDISAHNVIASDQIAEARISYGGRGQITNLQQPRIGNQIIDILSPF